MSTLPRDPEALLRRLDWTVIRRLDGLLHGDYRTLFRGTGLDLADLREYQFQDDVRHIDWNVTARLNTPYVREYLEDREVAAWFIVDRSGSLGFGSGALSKRDLTVNFVSVVAKLLSRHGNAVGLYGHDAQQASVLPARTGRRHLLQVVHALQSPTAPATAGRTTDLGAILHAAAGCIKRRSLLFVVSDFISTPGWPAVLARLAQRHEVIALRVHDPLESSLPDLGLVTLEDIESGEQIQVDTEDRAFRRRFEAAAQRREEAVRQGMMRAGVDTLEVGTTDDLADAVLRFADLRRQRSRLASAGSLPAHLAPGAAGAQ